MTDRQIEMLPCPDWLDAGTPFPNLILCSFQDSYVQYAHTGFCTWSAYGYEDLYGSNIHFIKFHSDR